VTSDFSLEAQIAVASPQPVIAAGIGTAAQEPEIELSVSTLAGKKVKVMIKASATISQLKTKLEQQCGKAASTMDITTGASALDASYFRAHTHRPHTNTLILTHPHIYPHSHLHLSTQLRARHL
jgi:hypothetical protein